MKRTLNYDNIVVIEILLKKNIQIKNKYSMNLLMTKNFLGLKNFTLAHQYAVMMIVNIDQRLKLDDKDSQEKKSSHLCFCR